MLVERHADSVAAAAHGDCRVHLAGLDSPGAGMREIGIIATLAAESSEIFKGDVVRFEIALNHGFEFISGMVAA